MKETLIACILIIMFTGLGILAGYKIKGVEHEMDCRENTVVIHKGVRR